MPSEPLATEAGVDKPGAKAIVILTSKFEQLLELAAYLKLAFRPEWRCLPLVRTARSLE